MSGLTHLDRSGRARMVDVTDKPSTERCASAEGRLTCAAATLEVVLRGEAPKGSVIQIAELAGVMGAKATGNLIPLCHPLMLSSIKVTIATDEALPGFRVEAQVKTAGATGVEMEALTAVSIACLTLFDMLKAIDRGMVIGDIRVTAKSGGQSGAWESGG